MYCRSSETTGAWLSRPIADPRPERNNNFKNVLFLSLVYCLANVLLGSPRNEEGSMALNNSLGKSFAR